MQTIFIKRFHVLLLLIFLYTYAAFGQESANLARCEAVPLPKQHVSMRIDGVEKVAWHFAPDTIRPFFFPFNGPSGATLTRMGHPGAPDHDHHQSIWFAHQSVNGVDFWSNNTEARIRQKQWLCYQDGNDEAAMALLLGWYDQTGRELMEQEVVVALIPMQHNEHMLEFSITLKPRSDGIVKLGKTNFGLLAVRVAKSISAHFGGGELTGSEGSSGEPSLFGKAARWMDYSGPVAVGTGSDRKAVVEGITYFDHPSNPRYPTSWHVREDGWMGASFCMHDEYEIPREKPLVLRYLLHAHAGAYDHERSEDIHREFTSRPALQLERSEKKHVQFEVTREQPNDDGTEP